MEIGPRLRLVPPPQEEPAPTNFEGVFRQYGRYVAAIALRILGRDDEVDDVVQDVFLVAMQDIGKLRQRGALKGWLATVTVRTATRRLRLRRLRRLLHLDRTPSQLAAPGASPEQQALLSRVYRLLDALPVANRVAWTLRHLEGEQIDAVAQLCSCSQATAKRRIAAAHEAIERMLANDQA